MRKLVRTVMVYLTHQDEVLLLFHDKCKAWMGPGGKIEPNETAHEAVTRELLEEAGLHLPLPGKPLGDSGRTHEFVPPFAVCTYKGFSGFDDNCLYEDLLFAIEVPSSLRETPLAPSEGHDVRWFSFDEAISLVEMYPDTRDQMAMLQHRAVKARRD